MNEFDVVTPNELMSIEYNRHVVNDAVKRISSILREKSKACYNHNPINSVWTVTIKINSFTLSEEKATRNIFTKAGWGGIEFIDTGDSIYRIHLYKNDSWKG